MNVKKYLRYILRTWVPLMVAFGAIVLSMTIVAGFSSSAKILIFEAEDGSTAIYYGRNQSAYSSILSMLVPSLLAACFLPFFAFSHRYGKVRADCYLSLPAKDGQVTRVHVLVLGVFLVAVYLVSFLFGSVVAIAHQFTQVAEAKAYLATHPTLTMRSELGSFGWYFAAWPLGALVVAAFYFTNCLFVSQGNNAIQGIIAMIAGNVIIACLIPVLCFTAVGYSVNSSWYYDFGIQRFFLMNGSIYLPVVLMEGIFGSLETNLPETAKKVCGEWSVWVGLFLFFSYGAASLVYLLCGKEPGGDFAGSDRPRNPLALALPHIAFGIGLTAMAVLTGVESAAGALGFLPLILFATCLVWISGLYYVVISLYNRSFKLNKAAWVSFGSVLGMTLLVYLTTTAAQTMLNP